MAGGPKILIVAGETSGEAHAARLAAALRRREPKCRLFGVGGASMRAAGVELVAEEDLGVIGFAEVVRRLPVLRRVQREVERVLKEEGPDLFVPVDYPGLNLRLCLAAKCAQVPVMYYISPQVWAWGRGRVKRIADRVDRMVTILPFEKALYEQAGVDVEFVGHPLLESIEPEVSGHDFRREVGIDPADRVVGLLPGSRRDEVSRLLPLMLHAGDLIRRRIPEIHLLVAAASEERARQIRRMYPDIAARVGILTGRTRAVIQASEVVLVASGTATLEAACLETPMVVLYRLSLLSWLIGRALVRVPHIALANLVAGDRVVPELIQREATPSKAAAEALQLLESEPRRSSVSAALARVRDRLGTPGASDRAASLALSMIAGDRRHTEP